MNRRSLSRVMPAVFAVPVFPTLLAAQSIPAFSGADGAGRLVTGGRGGEVYHVTKLDSKFSDTSAGTLRYGLNNANFPSGQPRTIVFDVGGTIWLGRNTTDTEGWDTQDAMSVPANVTIAGQTAPGGINLLGGTLKVNGNNAIIRNLVIAPGYGTRNTGADGMPDSYVYDAMNFHSDGAIVDHVSTYFATDETISADEAAKNITLQYSNVSQGQNYPDLDMDVNPNVYTGHALGSLWSPGSNALTSVHHNLYAHQKGRLPRVGTEAGKLTVAGVGSFNDFRDNVFYNWLGTAGSGAGGQPSQNNFVSNFYRAGNGGDNPQGGTTTAMTTAAGGTSIFSGADSSLTKVYHSGNLKDINKDGDANDGVALANSDFGSSNFQASAFAVPYAGVTENATAAYDRVLNYMGANWWNRNQIDARLVNETRNGTGQIMAWNDPTHGTEWNDLLALRGAANGGTGGTGALLRPTNWDSDGDGMPDTWEIAHGLDPAVADNNGDFDNDGYTNLEEYINEIAEWPAPKPLVFTGAQNNRYAQIQNWDIPWQPSRFDEAQVHNGNVAIDAVGQHAGVLNIAPTAGDNGVVTLSAGWIDIAQQLQIANAGQFVWSGGQLFVPAVQLSGTSQLKMTAGRDKVLDVTSLSITGSAKLDLGDNRMIVRNGTLGSWTGSTYTGVTGQIQSGRNGGPAGGNLWNGSGIVTSQSGATTGSLTSIGVVRAGDAGITTFAGRSVSANDVLVMYTYGGDANLDGKINVDDYGRIDSSIPLGIAGWYNGDFNYDGKVNVDDYGIIDSNIGIQGAPFSASLPLAGVANQPALSAVPEPSTFALLTLLPLALPRRTRKSYPLRKRKWTTVP